MSGILMVSKNPERHRRHRRLDAVELGVRHSKPVRPGAANQIEVGRRDADSTPGTVRSRSSTRTSASRSQWRLDATNGLNRKEQDVRAGEYQG